jgi:L-amino acid N-acyltransferase YncA
VITIRPATEADLEAITVIYNREVEGTTNTLDTEPRDERLRQAWFGSHEAAAYPLLAAEVDGLVAGWASLSPWSQRGGYARTVEASVFVAEGHRERGVGRELLVALIDGARQARHRVILARVESTNEGSRRLARSLGFASVGVMHQVGEKFGRVLDVELFELLLEEH